MDIYWAGFAVTFGAAVMGLALLNLAYRSRDRSGHTWATWAAVLFVSGIVGLAWPIIAVVTVAVLILVLIAPGSLR